MSPSRRRRVPREPRRAFVLAVVAVALGGFVAVSLRSSPSTPVAATTSVAAVGIAAESTAFYCGGLEHVAGSVESDVAIADLTGERHIVEVSTTNERGGVSLRQVLVAPGKVVHLSPASLAGGSLEAVSIIASGGGVAATESIRGVNGTAVAPCLTRAAPSWWVTGGSTTKGHSFVLSVFNPYASPAVVSITLLTASGQTVPKSLQGLVLGAHQLAALSVRAVAPGQSPITAHVVASDGNVVVVGTTGSTTGATSVGLLPGAPSLIHDVWFPVGSSTARLVTRLLLANPSAEPVDVTVPVWAPPGCSPHCPAQFTVTIGPAADQLLTLSPASRVPTGRGMAAGVRGDAAGLVVAQQVASSGSFGQNAPVADPTLAAGGRLVLLNPLASGFDDVGMVNPSSRTVHVSLETVGRHGAVAIGGTYAVSPHDSLELGPRALRGMVGGLLVVLVDGPLSAAADVHDAVRGAGVLVAVPAS